MNLFEEIEEIRAGCQKAALCIIVQTKGSTPRKVGAKMIVCEDESIYGTIGGGNLEKKVIQNALKQLVDNKPKYYKHDLLHQHNMCCGGSVEIYIEPIYKMKKLYIFGAGHTGIALSKLAIQLNFEVYVIDDRKEYLDELQGSGIDKMNVDYKVALPSLPFDKNTFIVIMTYEHSHDRDILSYCIKQDWAYLGMIGSKRKVELTKKMFLESDIATKKELNRVDMPMGIEINAEGPEEIAISIIAKLINVKNG